jgi:hypothetical protein
METVHGFEDLISPTGTAAWKVKVAMRGDLVDGVRAPQRV